MSNTETPLDNRIPAKYLKEHHYAQAVYWDALTDEQRWLLLVEAGIIDRKYEDTSLRGRLLFLEVWQWREMTQKERIQVLDKWAELIGVGYELLRAWPKRANKVEAIA